MDLNEILGKIDTSTMTDEQKDFALKLAGLIVLAMKTKM